MLTTLNIRNIVLVEELDLDFKPGLNVLTGETGSGKSILLDCLGFVLGWKVRPNLIREGCKRGEVTAEFQLDKLHPLRQKLDSADIKCSENLIIRRAIYSDGRKKCYVNDNLCSLEFLRMISSMLIELHGQKDDKLLLTQKSHLKLLDNFAGTGDKLNKLKDAWNRWQSSRTHLQVAIKNKEKNEGERDFIVFSLNELEELKLEFGEEASLEARKRTLKASEKINANLRKASNILSGDGAEKIVLDAAYLMREVSSLLPDEKQPEHIIACLDNALDELSDSKSEIDQLIATLSMTEKDLDAVEDRLIRIRELSRKHRVEPDQLPELINRFSKTLGEISNNDENIKTLLAKEILNKNEYLSIASVVSKIRVEAGKRLDNQMHQQLSPLRMEATRFKTQVLKTDKYGADGSNSVVFLVSINPGSKLASISDVASGGEMSRILLALKVCLTSRSNGITLVFDEIDRGVGGATADAVGQRLYALAENLQVLAVTHSPQVAAKANTHLYVTKEVCENNLTRTAVERLGVEETKREIARMLSGKHVTDEALAAAEKLISHKIETS